VGLTVEGHSIDIRVVTMPTAHGEGVVMRILNKEQALISMDALGMSPDSYAAFSKGYGRSFGAVLVTGPTGSGKSTTLYAALNAINDPSRKIITIEDPVEYQVSGINQLQVSTKAGLTFASALRAMLRADPDVIMVGEIRDAETARIAIESALTGHLVLSTLHTNDAPSAVTRLTEMDVEPFLSASAIACIVAQRLVRTICTYCKRRTMLSVQALEAAGFHAAFDVEAYEPKGCSRCGSSGYKGRVGVYEVMEMSDELRTLTVERASADEISRVAIQQGMRTLRLDGFEKVKNGVTSIAEVARVT
jgi:type IV pilus assembly protein PilB